MKGVKKMSNRQSLRELIKKLPPEYEQEVYDFIEFLLNKKRNKCKKKFNLDWRGTLSNMKDKYTSVELQHKILQCWDE